MNETLNKDNSKPPRRIDAAKCHCSLKDGSNNQQGRSKTKQQGTSGWPISRRVLYALPLLDCPDDCASGACDITAHAAPTLRPSTPLRYTQAMEILRLLSRLSRAMFATGRKRTQNHMTHIVAGNIAPGFSLKSLDNKEYSLATLVERGPVVAAFFKISCPVCQFTFPFLERLYKHYGGHAVTFLGISQDDARSTTKFAREYGITFPIVIDDENGYVVSNAYGLTNVPTIFLIDIDGTVKVSSMGFDKKDLETVGAELAERKKISLAPLFRPDEIVPANKPG